jgi:hypothetical protein
VSGVLDDRWSWPEELRGVGKLALVMLGTLLGLFLLCGLPFIIAVWTGRFHAD